MSKEYVEASEIEKNIALVSEFVEEVWNKGNLDVISRIVAAGCTTPSLTGDDFGIRAESSHEFLAAYVKAFRTAFPDLHVTIDEIFGAEDKVVRRATWRGTHKQRFQGVAATGRPVEFSEIAISCVHEGKISGGCQVSTSILNQIS